MLVCLVGCCLSAFRCFDLIVETFITEFVLVSLFFAVPSLDYYSAFSASDSFWWLLLVPSRRSNKFALICAPFVSVIIL
jgi:hypothetical protein